MNRREFLTTGLSAAATLPLGATVVPLDSKKFPSVLKATGSDAMRGRGPLISARPYVQLLEENEVGVVWTTSRLATGYAEWKQEGTDWQTCWMENDGFLSANKLIHKAVLSGFDPKKPLKYRVVSRELWKLEPYLIEYVGEPESVEGELNAVVKSDGAVEFIMFNDVHSRPQIYDLLLPYAKGGDYTFALFNGDIMDWTPDTEEIRRALFAPMALVTKELKCSCWYLRGNHETRGAAARVLRDWVMQKQDHFYGAVTIGETRFVFIDTGEDKPDATPVYGGIVDFDGYLAKQIAWLEREFASPEWKNAKYRIVSQHIPPILPAKTDQFYVERMDKLVDCLAKADITLMFCAHWHTISWFDPKPEDRRPYPIIMGGGCWPDRKDQKVEKLPSIISCRIDGKGIHVKAVASNGATVIEKHL